MFIEISYPIAEDSPKYPGSPADRFESVRSILSGSDANTSTIHHHLHNGTHVDSPLHFCVTGLSIDAVTIDDFVYSAPLVVSLRKGRGETISRADIEDQRKSIGKADILLFATGYDRLRATDPAAYVDDFPSLSLEAARMLRREFRRLKAVGIDTLSIESSVEGPARHFPVHRALLSSDGCPERPLLVYEDVFLEPLIGVAGIRRIYAFPLRLTGLEASPVTIVVETI